jgi:hypothetical protein
MGERIYKIGNGVTITQLSENGKPIEFTPLIKIEGTESFPVVEEYDDSGDLIKSYEYSIEAYDLSRSAEATTVCYKKDGFGIIVVVNTDEHGSLGNESSPAHIHVFDTNRNELGEVNINGSCPQKPSEVAVYRKPNNSKIQLYLKNIVEWANKLRRVENDIRITNWDYAKSVWKKYENERNKGKLK